MTTIDLGMPLSGTHGVPRLGEDAPALRDPIPTKRRPQTPVRCWRPTGRMRTAESTRSRTRSRCGTRPRRKEPDMAETDVTSVLNVIRSAKQQPANSASRRAAIQEAERFLNERKGKLRPEEERQIRDARRELDS